jgi:hypothetical protein
LKSWPWVLTTMATSGICLLWGHLCFIAHLVFSCSNIDVLACHTNICSHDPGISITQTMGYLLHQGENCIDISHFRCLITIYFFNRQGFWHINLDLGHWHTFQKLQHLFIDLELLCTLPKTINLAISFGPREMETLIFVVIRVDTLLLKQRL